MPKRSMNWSEESFQLYLRNQQRLAKNKAVQGPFETGEETRVAAERLMHQLGWLTWHCVDPRKSKPGILDTLAVKVPTLLCVEFKSPYEKLTPDQLKWAKALAGVTNVEVWTVRPVDFWKLETRLSRR